MDGHVFVAYSGELILKAPIGVVGGRTVTVCEIKNIICNIWFNTGCS